MSRLLWGRAAGPRVTPTFRSTALPGRPPPCIVLRIPAPGSRFPYAVRNPWLRRAPRRGPAKIAPVRRGAAGSTKKKKRKQNFRTCPLPDKRYCEQTEKRIISPHARRIIIPARVALSSISSVCLAGSLSPRPYRGRMQSPARSGHAERGAHRRTVVTDRICWRTSYIYLPVMGRNSSSLVLAAPTEQAGNCRVIRRRRRPARKKNRYCSRRENGTRR